MLGFQLQRLGLVMAPGPGNPLEAEGVLNPGAARGRDGQPYLFPRLVADTANSNADREQAIHLDPNVGKK
jgi:hypothetical protein